LRTVAQLRRFRSRQLFLGLKRVGVWEPPAGQSPAPASEQLD
jgi:hypothetical protein